MPADPLFPDFEIAISAERFKTYLAWAGGDRNRAVDLYSLNAILSESLYVPLQMLEVALRNRIHHTLSAKVGQNWFDLSEFQINTRQSSMLAAARTDLAEAKKNETPGAIVAAMTFGYWTAMLGKEYENLWQTTLNPIARREDGKGLKRKDFARPLGPIRMLRNRIAHHEPILYWDLEKHHNLIMQLTRWLSPVAADWSKAHSRFFEIFPASGINLASLEPEPSTEPRAFPS